MAGASRARSERLSEEAAPERLPIYRICVEPVSDIFAIKLGPKNRIQFSFENILHDVAGKLRSVCLDRINAS